MGPLNDFFQRCHSVFELHVFAGRWRGGRGLRRERQSAYYLLLSHFLYLRLSVLVNPHFSPCYSFSNDSRVSHIQHSISNQPASPVGSASKIHPSIYLLLSNSTARSLVLATTISPRPQQVFLLPRSLKPGLYFEVSLELFHWKQNSCERVFFQIELLQVF